MTRHVARLSAIEHFAAAIVLSKREAFEACEAIADSERVLLRSGNASQAARLAALFELVEGRLVIDGADARELADVRFGLDGGHDLGPALAHARRLR